MSDKPNKEMNLWQRIHWVQEKLTCVGKSGYNKFQRYKYAKEEDILAALKPLFTEARLATTFSVIDAEVHQNFTTEGWNEKTKSPKDVHLSRVRVKLTVVNIDNPQEFTEILGVGDGMDGGDKHVYAALTGANKYVLMKAFLLPTGDDPESGDDQRNKPRQKESSSEAKPPKRQPKKPEVHDLITRIESLDQESAPKFWDWWVVKENYKQYTDVEQEHIKGQFDIRSKILNASKKANDDQ